MGSAIEPTTTKHARWTREAQRHRQTGLLEEDDDAEQILSRREVLLSACLWAMIFIAVASYWMWSSGAAVVESFLADRRFAATCWSKPLPGVVEYQVNKSEQPELHRAFPTVTLHAPCPLRSYVKAALKYKRSAHAWRFVQASTIRKLQVEHHLERPLTFHADFEDDETLMSKLFWASWPTFGLLTPLTATFHQNLRPGRHLVTLVPEPALDGPAVDRKYRRIFADAGVEYWKSLSFAYMLPSMYPDWVASEFGVTSFPSIVVHKEFPGRPIVYTGDMSRDAVFLFLQDLLKGCADYKTDGVSSFFNKPERFACSAEPVLTKSKTAATFLF